MVEYLIEKELELLCGNKKKFFDSLKTSGICKWHFMIEIDFSKYRDHIKIKQQGGKRYLFDPIRQKFLVMTPEELVRQLVILHLIEEKNFNRNRIAIEKTLMVNDLVKRCDILVYDREMKPFLLVECKASTVAISQKTFRQIAWYNLPLKVDYLLVTNGLETFCCEMDYTKKSFRFLAEIPEFKGK